VNIAGSFLLGAAVPLLSERLSRWRSLWPLLATGFCGSFTTFSTFAVEVDLRFRTADLSGGIAYALVTVTIGLAALLIGMLAGRNALRYGTETARQADATSGRR
jgi:CrcB protein